MMCIFLLFSDRSDLVATPGDSCGDLWRLQGTPGSFGSYGSCGDSRRLLRDGTEEGHLQEAGRQGAIGDTELRQHEEEANEAFAATRGEPIAHKNAHDRSLLDPRRVPTGPVTGPYWTRDRTRDGSLLDPRRVPTGPGVQLVLY